MNDTPTPKLTVYENRGGEVWERHPDGCRELFAEDIIRKLTTQERELTAAREEITLLETNLKIQTKHTENAVQDRADEHIELHNQIHKVTEQRDAAREEINTLKTMCISNANEANDLRQQRDRLAEAIQDAIDCGMIPITSAKEGGAAKYSIQVRTADKLREALQSLNQPTEL
jgi:chromosome segregation ATPase